MTPYEKKIWRWARYRVGQRLAISKVCVAVKAGKLPKPSEFCCSDCDNQAIQYDHRDYNKPLSVDPVCQSCNLQRGKAIPRRNIPIKHNNLVKELYDKKIERNSTVKDREEYRLKEKQLKFKISYTENEISGLENTLNELNHMLKAHLSNPIKELSRKRHDKRAR